MFSQQNKTIKWGAFGAVARPTGTRAPTQFSNSLQTGKTEEDIQAEKPTKWVYTDEDIAAWRAARKRKYPSKQNAETIAEEERAKEQRGEVASLKTYRVSSLHRGPGVVEVKGPKSKIARMDVPKAAENKSNLGLVAYSSSEDDNEDEKPSEVSSKVPSSVAQNDNNGQPKAIAPKSTENDNEAMLEIGPDNKISSKLKAKQFKASLLERLLAKEVRKERNTVMQCIRFIVKTNFFETFPDVDETSCESSSEESSGSESDSESSDSEDEDEQ
eukprot:m.89551 g.89551  ORF g.89551 m.89551 type:complete len:272 (-) comp13228_c0_seq2:1218-2033(-)